MRRAWILLIILVLGAEPLAGFWKRGRTGADSQGRYLIRYQYKPGDVLTFRQIFYAERQVRAGRPETYILNIQWTVKMAVVGVHNNVYQLAFQYNRENFEVVNRAELRDRLGAEEYFDLFRRLSDYDPQAVRYLLVTDSGKNVNGNFYYNEMASSLHPLLSRVFQLPEDPVAPGDSYDIEAEEPLKIVFEGVQKTWSGETFVFTCRVPGGEAQIAHNRSAGVPDRLIFQGAYIVDDCVVKEHFQFLFIDKQRMTWAEMQADDGLSKAVLLSSLRKNRPFLGRKIVEDFLASPFPENQNLAAAYLGLRGIPAGLNPKIHLDSPNPVVKYNAAKALFLYRKSPEAMTQLAEGPPGPVRDRAESFLKRSSYVVPRELLGLYKSLEEYIYLDKGDPASITNNLDSVKQVLNMMKPFNTWTGGFYKHAVVNPLTGHLQPFYLHLPPDYDPMEIHPMVIYFGGGDGKGDLALSVAYQNLMKNSDLAGHILFVPQAEGMWWEQASEEGLRAMFLFLLKQYSIDTNRLYASGTSNGGMATFYYGTHYADRFAAIASNMGYPVVKQTPPETIWDREVLRNLLHTSVYMAHGDNDTMIFPEGQRRAFSTLKRFNYAVAYDEWAGRNHDIGLDEIRGRIVDLFKNSRRLPSPSRIELVVNERESGRSFWIRVNDIAKRPARVTAEILPGTNVIEIRAQNVLGLTVFLEEDLIDVTRDVVIRVNGRPKFSGSFQSSVAFMLSSARETLDPLLSYPAAIELTLNKN